jgi:hypothetical protein
MTTKTSSTPSAACTIPTTTKPLRPHVARVLDGMADVSEEEYYSLCCRLDTLEHIQAVLAAMAQARRSPGGSGAQE